MNKRSIQAVAVAILGLTIIVACRPGDARRDPDKSSAGPLPLGPTAVLPSVDGKTLRIACAGTSQLALFDIASGKIAQLIDLPAEPTGLAQSPDGSRLYVSCSDPDGTIAVLDANEITEKFRLGHSAFAPVLNPKGNVLYVARRFTAEVVAMDTASGKIIWTAPAVREPVAAALTPDGSALLVANLLPSQVATAEVVAASVSILDAGKGQVLANIVLPSGSSSLRDLRISPDGKLAAIPHILGRFNVPTTQLERGWMNTNALTLIDIPGKKILNTILLDDVDSGAANPFAVAWTPDGAQLCITHAGTQEISVIDVPGLLTKLQKSPAPAEVPNDLAFLVGLRRRIHLAGNGPRSIAILAGKAYVPEYFSDSLSIVNLADGDISKVTLGSVPMTVARKGEMFFHDASLCFQGWQSCSSCHPDARADGLNWDLLNDGIGNPKNTKSMLLAHKTPPSMSLGIRDTAETAVRSGIRYIQFAVRPEEDAVAIDEYLKSLKPTSSPHLDEGRLSSAARRGQKLFADPLVGCVSCHTPPLYTSLHTYNVGTKGPYDGDADTFDTPSLVEVWRTAPYLHDGSAATIRDVLTTHNKTDQHGHVSQLTPQQFDDLVAYVLSL